MQPTGHLFRASSRFQTRDLQWFPAAVTKLEGCPARFPNFKSAPRSSQPLHIIGKMERRPLPKISEIGPKGRVRHWLWWRRYKLRRWWRNLAPLEFSYGIGMLRRSGNERPYLTWFKMLSPIPWRYKAELPPEPREIMADTDAVLAAEAQTHELRWIKVWRWHDTPMSVLVFCCANLASLILLSRCKL